MASLLSANTLRRALARRPEALTISKKEALDMLKWIPILLAGSSCLIADTLYFHNGATVHGSFVGAEQSHPALCDR